MKKLRLFAVASLLVLSFAAIAKPANGTMGVYMNDQGQVIGTWVMSCDGQFSWSGSRSGKMITNGWLWCNFP